MVGSAIDGGSTADSSRMPLPLDTEDAEALAAAEPGARSYLQLSDMSDESLQVRMVQWYPGHIARAERQLKSQLGMVDVVLEVRDARIPVSTHHPQVAGWVGSKPVLLLLNRADEVSQADRRDWVAHYAAAGQPVFWTDGRSGDGVRAVKKELLKVAAALNAKRAARGLQPRPVRACVIGFPNIGKSALINRLVNRRAVQSAPKPGVTRALRWVRVDSELDLLDAPGVIPASFRDQLAAQRLAMCNDIGEAAYLASAVGAALVARVKQLAAAEAAAAAQAAAQAAAAELAAETGAEGRQEPAAEAGKGARQRGGSGRAGEGKARRGGSAGGRGGGGGGGGVGAESGSARAGGGGGGVMAGVLEAMRRRYGVDPLTVGSAEDFIVALAERSFGGDPERAGLRLLSDYRSGTLGRFALERPRDAERRRQREAGLQAAAERREQEREQRSEGAGAGAGAGAPLEAAPGGSAPAWAHGSAPAPSPGWAGAGVWGAADRHTSADALGGVGVGGRGGGGSGGGGGGGLGGWGGAPEVNSSWVVEAERMAREAAAAAVAQAEAQSSQAQGQGQAGL